MEPRLSVMVPIVLHLVFIVFGTLITTTDICGTRGTNNTMQS